MRSWDDLLTDEEREKLGRFKARREATRLPASAMMLAELGDFFGWGAVHDALTGVLDARTIMLMVRAGRRLHNRRRAEQVGDVFNAVACAQMKNGDRKLQQVINKLTREE